MSKQELSIAVVGAGLIGRKHIEIVAKHARLDAIVDPSPAAKTVADDVSAPWFDDLNAYLDTNSPDGVIVASPNHLHLAHGLACIEKRLPVLVEKPLADTVNAAQALVSRAASTQTPVLVGHHRRHSPVIKAAHTVLLQQRLGRLVSVNGMFWLHKPAEYFEMDWRSQPGGGPTYINLIHDIDLLQHLCGPIVAVQARESNGVRGFAVEDTSAIILTFENGALGTVTVSDTVSAPWSWELTSGENLAYPQMDQSCYMIGGTDGSLSLPDLKIWTHTGPQSWWSPMDSESLSVSSLDPVEAQFMHFLEVISGQAKPLVSAKDGLQNILVLDAIKRAAKSGATEEVARGD